jgi:hypothetical protein
MVTGHGLEKHAAAPSILPVSFALAGPILPVFFAPAPSWFRAILLRPLFRNSLLQPIEEHLACTQHQEAVSLWVVFFNFLGCCTLLQSLPSL